MIGETQFLIRDNAKIAFDVFATESTQQQNEILVLVNGFQRPRTDFRAFRKRIHEKQNNLVTVAIDNRGIGETKLETNGQFNVDDMAKDVVAVVQEVKKQFLSDSCSLLGISMGGMISIKAAAHGHFNNLILVSTTAGGHLRTFPESLKGQTKFLPWPEDFESMYQRMAPYFGKTFLKRSPLLVDAMIKGMLKSATKPQAQRDSQTQYDAGRLFDGIDELQNLEANVLIVSGDEDNVMPIENAFAIKNILPDATLQIYEGVGHLILIEAPEKFVDDIHSFLTKGVVE